MKRITVTCLIVLVALLVSRQRLFPDSKHSAKTNPPPPPIADISSCQVPLDIPSITPSGPPYQQIPFFDDYSWRAFAALICDNEPGQRGVPDATNGRDGSGPHVFETFKSAWETFHPGAVSDVWNRYESQAYNPCPNAAPGELVLASTSKFIDTVQSGEGHVPLAPLPARNRTYVHYLAQYNQSSFSYIARNLSQVNSPLRFPDGSINIKSAWVEMKDLSSDRFYTRKAWIPSGGTCQKVDVGLIGLHIAQKTHSRPN